jgi:hypothetical protein
MRGPDNRAIFSACSEPMKEPAAGKTNLRLINAATDEDDLALHIVGNADRVFDGVNLGGGTSVKEVGAGPAILELRSQES